MCCILKEELGRFWISWILKCEGKNGVKGDAKILDMSLSGGMEEKITEGISWATR